MSEAEVERSDAEAERTIDPVSAAEVERSDAEAERTIDSVSAAESERSDGTATDSRLPAPLAEVVEEFAAVSARDRLPLLLEYSRELPALPARYAEHRDLMESVPECQSPLFLAVEITPDRLVRLYFDAPPESPTTRGFAAILAAGLSGLPVGELLDVPENFYLRLGLADVVSPLRLRGMVAMLSRIKRQLRAAAPAGG